MKINKKLSTEKILEISLQMFDKKIKKFKERLVPFTKKLAEDTAKGYVFGSVFGVFMPGYNSVTESMHKTGKTFAKMSAVYTTAEFALESTRETKDIYNSIISGSLAGAYASNNHKFLGAAVFGAYSGIAEYLNEENNEK